MQINFENMSKIEKTLAEMLFNIWNENEFVFGVLNSLKSDDERKEVIEFIENSENATSEQIDLISLEINRTRDNTIVDSFFAGLEDIAKLM